MKNRVVTLLTWVGFFLGVFPGIMFFIMTLFRLWKLQTPEKYFLLNNKNLVKATLLAYLCVVIAAILVISPAISNTIGDIGIIFPLTIVCFFLWPTIRLYRTPDVIILSNTSSIN